MEKTDIKKERFILKVKNIHGDKVDTSKVKYVDSKTKVCLICPKHGEYWQTPAACVRGNKCPKCSNETRGPKGENRMTTEKFIEKANRIHKGKYDYSKASYVNANTKVCIICPEHGEFWQMPYAHLNGQGCPKCIGRTMSQDEIIKKFNEVHSYKYDYSKVKFTKIKEKVCIVCPEHGEFWQTPQKHLAGQGCPICAKESVHGTINENKENFIKLSQIVHNNSYDYSEVEYVNNITKVRIKCDKHGIFYQRPNNHLQGCGCPKCSNIISKGEEEIISTLNCNDVTTHNRSILCGKEIDIYIPSLKLGIEYDGLRWHSEIFNKDTNYHLSKTEECERQGIRLIHIFEDEWQYKRDIVKSRLLNLIGKTPNKIYARKCVIKEVDSHTASKFLDENHIQGTCNSSYRYGLYYNDELVSIMTFGKLRKNLGSADKDGYYELLRFCNKLNTAVVGGASKLFMHFLKEKKPTNVISYADRRWSNGNLYEKLGFTLNHKSKPSYFYVVNDKRENRFKYRKDVLVKEGYDSSKTEHQIMLERGIYRIYDCGCLVYEYKNGHDENNP